jgi:NAD(P) transhydrogenase
MRKENMTLRLGEAVEKIFIDTRDRIVTELVSGKRILSGTLLFSIGRQGATAGLNLPAVGLHPDERGRLQVNPCYQTVVGHTYAAGDVIGFPSLASTSMEQGRLAACHALGLPQESFSERSPIEIYTIPEISMAGETEEGLTKAHVPYETGIARSAEIAKGQIIGDDNGMRKLLFHRESHKLLGVHAIGDTAVEIIHIGQAVMAHGGCIEYFIDTVFNDPTLAEAYKIAVFDGLNKL